MNRALLPALIASIFAANGAIAADRELLFGPEGVVDTPAVKTKSVKAPKAIVVQPKRAQPAEVIAELPKADKPATKVDVASAPKNTPPAIFAEKKPSPVATKPLTTAQATPPVTVPAVVPTPKQVVAPAVSVAVPKVPPTPAMVSAPATKPISAPIAAAVAPKAVVPAVVTPIKAVASTSAAPAVMPALPGESAKSVKAPEPVKPQVKLPVAMPEIKPVAVANAPLAQVSEIKIDSGSDPAEVRKSLLSKFNQQITVGFFPSATLGDDQYNFLKNYLPLANHLSVKAGALVNFIPERNLQEYARRINDSRYPVIFINAALSKEAIAAGYVPLAVGEENLSPGFIVREDSKINSIADIKDVKVAWAKNAQISILAMSDFAKNNSSDKNQFEDVGNAGRTATLNLLNSKSVEVAIIRSTEAEKAVAQSNGKLRSIGVGTSAPASGMWVRKDLVGSEISNRLLSGLLSISPDSSDISAKDASIGFQRGFGIKGKFLAPPEGFSKSMSDIIDSAQLAFPDSFSSYQANESLKKANMARPAVEQISSFDKSGPIEVRKSLISKLSRQMTVGFFPSANIGDDQYNFLKNNLPLANHLSSKSGVLINFIPERNLAEYTRRINESRYPLIFINAALSSEASSSGYVPLAVGEEILTPSFVVRNDSKFKSISEINDVKIAWSRNAGISFLALADLAKNNVAEKNSFEDVGSAGRSAALNLLKNKTVDVAILRSVEADRAVSESQGELRSIGSQYSAPASGMWIRKDLVGSDISNRLLSAILSISPDSEDASAKEASIGFQRGFGLKGKFLEAPEGLVKNVEEIKTAAEAAFPDFFKSPPASESIRQMNLSRPVMEPINGK